MSDQHPDMVPGSKADMADALAQISQELGCQNNLEDILFAIQDLKDGQRDDHI